MRPDEYGIEEEVTIEARVTASFRQDVSIQQATVNNTLTNLGVDEAGNVRALATHRHTYVVAHDGGVDVENAVELRDGITDVARIGVVMQLAIAAADPARGRLVAEIDPATLANAVIDGPLPALGSFCIPHG